jgi:hypothetical protein
MTQKTKKKRNPADTTMRNVNALKKRVTELEVIATRHRTELCECKRAVRALLSALNCRPLSTKEIENIFSILNFHWNLNSKEPKP